MDDEFISKLYKDVISLYRLDQIGGSEEGRKDLGPLPAEAKLLLGSLAAVWGCILIINLCKLLKKYRQSSDKVIQK